MNTECQCKEKTNRYKILHLFVFFFCINSFILTPYIQLASVVFLIDILVDQKSLKDFSIPTESTVSLKTDVIKNMLDVASL